MWFKTKRTKQLEKQVSDMQVIISDLNQELDEMKQRNKKIEQTLFETEQSLSQAIRQQDDPHPWFVLKTAELDDDKGLRVEMDWNSAFINYVRKQGFDGKFDEVVVQKWLAALYGDIIGDIEDQIIDKNTQHVGDDYS